MNWALATVLGAVLGYLVGSIPWGFLLGKARGVDIRQHGSGKVGATNVLRTLGVRYALLALALDLAKGILAVLIARLISDNRGVEIAAALAAISGHNWSLFLRFSGGRGVTTGIGALLLMVPWVTLTAIMVGVLLIAIWRYVSLGSMVGSAVAAAGMIALAWLGLEPWEYTAYAIFGALIVILQHKDNILRLARGSERRLGEKTSTPPLVVKQTQRQAAP